MVTFNRKQPALNLKYYEFLNRESLVDATIIADGHVIQAHKVILAAASSYFEEIFALIPDKHPAIVLSDVTQLQLKALMQYIYCGKVDIKENEVGPFRKILDTLKIEIHIDQTEHSKTSHLKSATVTSNQKTTNDEINEIQIKEEKLDEESCVQVLDSSEYMDDSSDFQEPEIQITQQRSLTFKQRFSLPNVNPTKPQQTPRIVRVLTGNNMTSRNRTKIEAVVRNRDHRRFMEVNPLDCPFCMKTSSTNKHRNEHVKYCTINPDRIVSKCHYCDKNFCDPYYVRKHMKTIHGDKDVSSVMKKKN